MTILAPEQSGKRLELLTEAVPGVSRVAVLWNPADRYAALEVRVMEAAARALGVQLQSLEVRNPGEFERAFDAATRDGVGALSILATPFIALNLGRIVNLALEHRLPAIFWARRFAEAGGLMAYGHQPEDRPGTRDHDSPDVLVLGRRGDPLGVRRGLPSRTRAWSRLPTASAALPLPAAAHAWRSAACEE